MEEFAGKSEMSERFGTLNLELRGRNGGERTAERGGGNRGRKAREVSRQ
jgi:hypothetical protein